jgi:hypothetical protein
MFRDDELKNRVPQKLEPLIVELLPFRLVAQTRMRQRFREQEWITKLMTDAFLERTHINAFDKSPAM